MPLPPDQTPWPTEDALRAALAGAPADIVFVRASGNCIVRAAVLRGLLIGAGAVQEGSVTRLILRGARIEGWLGLEGLELKLTPSFIECAFDTGVGLSDAKVVGFDLIGGAIPIVRADRLIASGSLLLRKALVDPVYDHDQPANAPIRIARCLLMSGAKIHGNLDLRGCELGPDGGPDLGATCLLADGMTVEGNLLLSDGFRSTGEIRLNGCEVSRNLDCGGAIMTNPAGFSLSAAGAHVRGSIYLTRHGDQAFTSTGTFRLAGARVDGDLDATGAIFRAGLLAEPPPLDAPVPRARLDAIAADGLSVGANARFKDGFQATGVVSLVNAQIGANFECSSARFEFPGEAALWADGIAVSGATAFTDHVVTSGLLRFTRATLARGFVVGDLIFQGDGACRNYLGRTHAPANELGPNVCGLQADGAKIGGTFRLSGILRQGAAGRLVWLSMPYATANTVEDDRPSWDVFNRIDIRDCDYQSLFGVTDAEIGWRLRRLDREYIGDFAESGRWCAGLTALFSPDNRRLAEARLRFAPQPYLKLAQVVRSAGYEGSANRILVHLERNRNCFGGMNLWHQIARWTLDLFLRYGFSPFRPVLFLIGWAAFSAICFQAAYEEGRLAASHNNLIASTRSLCAPRSKDPEEVCFDPDIYAIDTLVPLVDLNQKKNFVFPRWSPLLLFNSSFGWTMTSLFAAGVSGLTRRGGS